MGNRFVERLGGHIERMRGVVQVVDDDGAGFEAHDGNLSYSLFVPWERCLGRGTVRVALASADTSLHGLTDRVGIRARRLASSPARFLSRSVKSPRNLKPSTTRRIIWSR